MTKSQLEYRIRLATKPWKAYFPFRPDDMPPKNGNPEMLKKLAAEFYTENDNESV